MRITLTTFILFVFSFSFAQVPGVKWTNSYRTFGSNQTEAFFDVKRTPDGGFILAGSDSSYSYNKEDYLKKYVAGLPWLIKTDNNGNISWRWTSGSYPYQSSFTSVVISSDGNIVASGYGRYSSNVPKYFIAKFSAGGTKLWEKYYGSVTGLSRSQSMIETSDGGYMLAGYTTSDDGDVVGNHNTGSADVWLLKLDGAGNIQWQKCFGGTGEDSAYAIIQTPDYGFVVAGSSTSSNGDLTNNNGLSDAWIFKTDSIGNLLWQKNIGGSNHDGFKSIVFNSDTTYTVTGYTSSSTLTDNGNYGSRDLWLIKIKDADGDIQWSKNFGGSQDDQGFSVQRTIGNGYLVSGYTESNDHDITSSNGLAEAWMLKLSSDGGLIWQKCVGTNKNDYGTTGLYLSETDFAMCGYLQPLSQANYWDTTDAFLTRLGNVNTIKGFVFYDANSNGVKDASEVGFNDALVTATNSNSDQTSAVPQNGAFSINVDIGTYTTAVHVNNPYYVVSPSTSVVTFSNYFNTSTVNFAVQPIPSKKDLVINIIPLSTARTGRENSYRIFYKNVGTVEITSGEVHLMYDTRQSFTTASPNPYSSTSGILKWSFSNLKPFDSASILVNFQVGIPPTVNMGDTLGSLVTISPVAGDETPSNDSVRIKQRVVTSYDPNDKTENNGGIIGSDYITQGKSLNYTIRFQNTGTDTAFNVIVRDTLDNKLDWSTFEMVAASHPYTVSITNQNKIEWAFSNINLPDSNINEPLSHGYLSYHVKPKSTAVVGDVINNLASIYFDYNLPVATNNALTLVQDNFISLPIQLVNFTGQLSNSTVQLNWKADRGNNFEKFEIERSVDGKTYTRIATVQFKNAIDDYHLVDNISLLQSKLIFYRLKMIDADGKFSYSKVIVFRTNPIQNSFTIYPNPARTEVFVSLMTDKTQSLRLKVLDASERVISEQRKEVQKGANVFPVNISNLKAGNYILQILGNAEMKTERFTIMN